MPNSNENKDKVWCSAFSNCLSRATPSAKTWVSSSFTDAVRGLGCKVLDGEPDESRPSSPVEKGEDVVCTLQPKTPSEEQELIPLVTKEQTKKPDSNLKCPQECSEVSESRTCSTTLVHNLLPQLSCDTSTSTEDENCNSLGAAIPPTSESAIFEFLSEAVSECSEIGSSFDKDEELSKTPVDFITPFVNQESEFCYSFQDTTPSENQEQSCEIDLNAVEPNEASKISTFAQQQSSDILESAVFEFDRQNKLSATRSLLEPTLYRDQSFEDHLILVSRVEQLEEIADSLTEKSSEQGSIKEFHAEESVIEKQIQPELNADNQLKKTDPVTDILVQPEEPVVNSVSEKPNQNGVVVQSGLANQEITAELIETKILLEGEPLEALSNSISSEEKRPSSEKRDSPPTEKLPVELPSSSATEPVLLPPVSSPTMESLTTGTEMLSISSLEDNLGSSREVSPSSDDLLETLAYVPDLDDTDDVDLDCCDVADDDESKVLQNAENGELDSFDSSVSPSITTNDNAPETTPATNNNPTTATVTTTAVSSEEAIITNTTTTNTATAPPATTASSNNKKKNKKNAVTNNNTTTTTTEPTKADNKNNNANLSGKGETKRVETKDQGPRSQKSNSKNKKRDDKSTDHILRALSSLGTPEEKLAALCKKYADLHEENRELAATDKQSQRKIDALTRKKEQLQLENNKSVMAKSQLESLCRELQKHNRLIKEESLARAREEDEKRKEISAKFQTTINEIQAQMVDNHDRNMKLREENTELASKLKTFLEQYEQREKYFEKIVKHRELEQQLADAKLKQASMQLLEEKEKNKKEREFMMMKATETDSKMILLEKQVKTYKDQYSEFQSTITKSNDMFSKLRGEMDKMTSKIKKLEKDSASWKTKWENCNKALLGMIDQKTTMDRERFLLQTKIQKLESLCRAQQERLRAQKSPPPAEECRKCCFAECSSTPSSNDNLPAETDQATVTDSSPKTDETADPDTPAESCVSPDSVTTTMASTVVAPDSLPDPQATEIPSASNSECSAASSTAPTESTTDTVAEKTTDVTAEQSCHNTSSVGDNSNCCSTDKESPSSDTKQAPLVDHTAPVTCTQTT